MPIEPQSRSRESIPDSYLFASITLAIVATMDQMILQTCLCKKLGVALYSELLIFVSFNKMFSNFFREDENEFMSASYGLKRMTCYLIQ